MPQERLSRSSFPMRNIVVRYIELNGTNRQRPEKCDYYIHADYAIILLDKKHRHDQTVRHADGSLRFIINRKKECESEP